MTDTHNMEHGSVSKEEKTNRRIQFWKQLVSMGEEAGNAKDLDEYLQEWTKTFEDLEVAEEREEGLDMVSNIKEILNSSSTIESQAKERGQEWTNLGWKLFQEHTGCTEAQMAIRLAMDFSPYSPVPWTSYEPETRQEMEDNVRKLNKGTLRQSWKLKAQVTHPDGMLVQGKAVFEPDEELPLISFFRDNGEIAIQARFSNSVGPVGTLGMDDRIMAARGCSLKLRQGDKVFDLVCQTGSVSPFQNFLTFAMQAKMASQLDEHGNFDQEGLKKWLSIRPAHWYNMVETLVKDPSSYSRLQYYQKYPLLLTSESGTEHYCKFRIVPAKDGQIEMMPEQTQRTIWNRNVDPDDKRPADYLRQEMSERLSEGPVKFTLEMLTKQKTGSEGHTLLHPSGDWNQPWKKLATIDMTGTVDDEKSWWAGGRVGGWATFPGVVPNGLSIIEPFNSQDPSWINWARDKVYKANASIRNVRRFADSKENAEETKYIVTLSTGDVKYAGTDDNIFIVMIGDNVATNKRYLDKSFRNDFERGDTAEYSFKDRDVGNIKYIIMGKETSKWTLEKEWYLEKVVVKNEKTGYDTQFPFFQWMTKASPNPLIIASNHTSLPQNENEIRRSARLLETSLMNHWEETKFSWSYNIKSGENIRDVSEALPGFIKVQTDDELYNELDSRLQWNPERFQEFKELRKMLKKTGFGSAIRGFFDPITRVEDFKNVADELPEKTAESVWMDNWDSDEEFGRQTMNGMNPINLFRIDELPTNFPVTDGHLGGILDRGLSLQEEIESGNMYMIDLKFLEGVSTGTYEGRKLNMAVPMVLFYLPSSFKLVPVAIQLGQVPGADFPIWTPNDTREDWLLAKFWFRNSDTQVAQLVTHLVQSHLVLEPFALGMLRCLSTAHPIQKLMKENLRFLIAINTLGREVLISQVDDTLTLTVAHGSTGVTEILAKGFQNYSFQEMNYKNDLIRRDVMDLPGYHHRDDSIMLWDATLSYIQDMVDLYYNEDTDVMEDWELQDWVKDVFENGFGKMKNLKQASFGVPSSLSSKTELVDYLQTIFFGTVRHSFANFYAFEYLKFAPNAPTMMRGQIPREEDRGQANLEALLASLPSRKDAFMAAATAKVLSGRAPCDIYLRETPNWMFLKEEPRRVFEKFVEKLNKIEEEIEARNASLDIPYTVLQPSRIPAGVAI